ncbi:MAG: enoyl-CoA hydratase/isomerase family protein [Planctomycetaceae bacterium]|nr:enoyl-CoA hydratase/isomerase family protein [Planctomycetaceae bacterium]
MTLNRPERRNALTIELMEALCETLAVLATEPQRRLVILNGAGSAFCAGLDLHESANPSFAERGAEWVARTLQTVSQSPLVTIAAAHGAAFAGGAGLLSCCDFAIGTPELKIAFPEVRRGLVPALVGAILQDRLRDADLRELFFIGEPVDAQRAQAMGLVQRIVPADRLLDEARTLATTILQGAPDAVRQTKRLLQELRSTAPSQRLTQALEFHKRARASDEAREGIAAFFEHRAPDWK